MKTSFLIFSFIVFIIPAYGQSFKIGFVKNVFEGAGDTVWLAGTKKKDQIDSKAIFSTDGLDGLGRINLNGRDIELKLIKDYLPDKNYKIGLGGYEIWQGKNTRLRLDYIFTWLCPPEDETCEVYHYRGVMTVTYKGKHRKLKIIGFGGS